MATDRNKGSSSGTVTVENGMNRFSPIRVVCVRAYAYVCCVYMPQFLCFLVRLTLLQDNCIRSGVCLFASLSIYALCIVCYSEHFVYERITGKYCAISTEISNSGCQKG